MAKRPRGRPRIFQDAERVVVALPRPLLNAVDRFAFDRLYGRAEALRALLARGLGKPYDADSGREADR